jgi:hypothetical protein
MDGLDCQNQARREELAFRKIKSLSCEKRRRHCEASTRYQAQLPEEWCTKPFSQPQLHTRLDNGSILEETTEKADRRTIHLFSSAMIDGMAAT